MWSIGFGVLCATVGATLWWTQQKTIISPLVWMAIFMICAGASSILHGLHFVSMKPKLRPAIVQGAPLPTWMMKAFVVLLIYLGTMAYTIASYYHLKFREWTFIKAFAIAIPFILIEYQFSIRGNYYAAAFLGMNAVQIALVTMTFYFVNSWMLNYFVLNKRVVWWREGLAFLFIACAFIVTTTL